MHILGGIHVLDGKLVSLYKGDLGQKIEYRATPLQMAKRWWDQGLEQIHFVDLSASKENKLVHKKYLEDIIKLGYKVQFAGGVRDHEFIDQLFDMGVHQVVLGVSAQNLIPAAIEKYGEEKILLGIKARYDRLVTESEGITNVLDFVEGLNDNPVKYLVYKDVLSEGIMIHPNYDMVEKIILLSNKEVYTSGGISEVKHLELLRRNGACGAIIGKAFYERELTISSALDIAI